MDTIVGLILSLTDIALREWAAKNEEKRKEIEIARNLLDQFGARLPKYVEYVLKYKDKQLTLDDLEALSMDEIDAEIDAQYED